MSTYTEDYTDIEKRYIEMVVDGEYDFSKQGKFYVAHPSGCPKSEDLKDIDLDFLIGFICKRECA